VTFGQISAPVAAFVFVYVAAVVVLLIQGFWTTDSFTGKVVHTWNLDNYRAIADAPFPRIIFRTIGMAAAVTVTCMVLAFPYAYFMVRVAGPRLRVILPLAVPGLAAGSIFTFSLTLGDYIAPSLVGGPGSSLIGTVVFENLGLANNAPFAAAFATVPLAIMAFYLLLMKRLGAFESL
jgi:ABC-type spermidine/putrescine transport system permease subunit I